MGMGVLVFETFCAFATAALERAGRVEMLGKVWSVSHDGKVLRVDAKDELSLQSEFYFVSTDITILQKVLSAIC